MNIFHCFLFVVLVSGIYVLSVVLCVLCDLQPSTNAKCGICTSYSLLAGHDWLILVRLFVSSPQKMVPGIRVINQTISCGRASNAEKSEKMINRLPENFEFSRGLFVPGDILPHNRTRDG